MKVVKFQRDKGFKMKRKEIAVLELSYTLILKIFKQFCSEKF